MILKSQKELSEIHAFEKVQVQVQDQIKNSSFQFLNLNLILNFNLNPAFQICVNPLDLRHLRSIAFT